MPYCSDEEKIENRNIHNALPETIEKRNIHLHLPETIQHRKEYRNEPEQVQSRRDYNQQKYNCECGFQCKNQPAVKEGHFRSPNHQKYILLQEKLKLATQPIINNITNINIEVVTTLNVNPIKSEQQELDELERDFELSMK